MVRKISLEIFLYNVFNIIGKYHFPIILKNAENSFSAIIKLNLF